MNFGFNLRDMRVRKKGSGELLKTAYSRDISNLDKQGKLAPLPDLIKNPILSTTVHFLSSFVQEDTK